jgi:hypothetical protein
MGLKWARAADLLERFTPYDYDPFTTLSSDAPTVTIGTSATLTGRAAGRGPRTSPVSIREKLGHDLRAAAVQ